MTQFSVLPAPPGYLLVEIDEDTFKEGSIDNRLSEPQPVLGFVVEKREHYFNVSPMTVFGVHDDGGLGGYALIRPDGKVDYWHCSEYIFDSIDDLKIHLLRDAAELDRETASDADKDDPKFAATCRRHARKLEKEASNYEWDD